jgi:uncharacterized protein (DUF1015 family)
MDSSLSPLLQPFAGERFASADLTPLLAPPYDVISPADRAALASASPHNIVHLILPDGNGDRYERAGKLYRQWRADGVLRRDAPSVYVLAQTLKLPNGRTITRTGMLAAVSAEPYALGRVRPHERTHAGPKQDRLSLIRALRGTFESIFLIAPDRAGALGDLLKQRTKAVSPTAEGAIDGVAVRLWRVDGRDAEEMTNAAATAPLYIADGHHRYETTLAYRAENPAATRTVGLVVPGADPGLTVLATHRVIKGNALSVATVRACMEPWFVVGELGNEAPGAALARLGSQGTTCLVALPATTLTGVLRSDAPGRLEHEIPDASVRALDVARIDRLVVGPLNERSGGHALEYTASLDDGLAAARAGAAAVVLLNPTGVSQVFAVADAKAVMPQKSTYFIPKVPSGLAGLSYESR